MLLNLHAMNVSELVVTRDTVTAKLKAANVKYNDAVDVNDEVLAMDIYEEEIIVLRKQLKQVNDFLAEPQQ